jgi:hypothetical protein
VNHQHRLHYQSSVWSGPWLWLPAWEDFIEFICRGSFKTCNGIIILTSPGITINLCVMRDGTPHVIRDTRRVDSHYSRLTNWTKRAGFMTSAIAGTHSCRLLPVGPSDRHSWLEYSQHTERALAFNWSISGTKLRLPGIFQLSWNFWHSADGRTPCEIRGSHSGFVVGYYVVPSDT